MSFCEDRVFCFELVDVSPMIPLFTVYKSLIRPPMVSPLERCSWLGSFYDW